MASLIIREAIAADIPAVAQLHLTTWNATYASMLTRGPSVAVRERQWREAFANDDGSWFCFVVENARGELVGFAKGTRSDNPEYGGEPSRPMTTQGTAIMDGRTCSASPRCVR